MLEYIKGLLGLAKAAETAKKVFDSPSRQVRRMIDAEKVAESKGYKIEWQNGNIAAIYRLTVSGMSSDNLRENAEKLRNLHPDWAAHALEAAENTSEPYMQSLWAKILGGEAERPGSFSKQTISIVKNMSKEDALMFTRFCQFAWKWKTNANEEGSDLLVHNPNHEIYHGFFPMADHLQYLGLISYFYGGIADFAARTQFFDAPPLWEYHGEQVRLDIPQAQDGKHAGKYSMNVGHVIFTKSGEQLCHICNPLRNDDFFQYILEKWRQFGYNPVIQEKGQE